MGLGCDDPRCCPEPLARTIEEKLLEGKLDFINSLASVYCSSGNRLDEVVIPKEYVELHGKDYLNIYQTDYGPVVIKNGRTFKTKVTTMTL